jgi:hypothetical protein
MLGLYTSAALREHGFETVYCSGTRLQRSIFIDRFGAIPLYNGNYILFFNFHLSIWFLHAYRENLPARFL